MKTTVPIDIRPDVEKLLGRESESWSMNSSRNRAGEPGETWVIATKTRLLIGDRGFGGPLDLREVPLADIQGVEVEGGSFGAGRVALTGKSGVLDGICFSALERDDFARFGDRLKAKGNELPIAEPIVLTAPGSHTKKRKKADEEIPMATEVSPRKSRGPLPARTRPVPPAGALELFLDQPYAFPGQPLRGVVRLSWPKSKVVRGVRLFWKGHERTHITTGSGKHRHTHYSNHTYAERMIPLFGVPQPLGFFGAISDALSAKVTYPVLEASTYEYPFEFDLPRNAPPSYAGTHSDITWDLSAQVDIPRAFDLFLKWPIRVVATDPRDHIPAQHARVAGSAVVSLSTEAIQKPGPGRQIQGTLSVQNPGGKTIRSATIEIIRREHARAGGHSRSTDTRETCVSIPGSHLTRGDIPFTLMLPQTWGLFSATYTSVSYMVKASLDVAWAFDCAAMVSL